MLMPEQWLALLLLGAIAGVAAGMFGIGGGVIIVPALTLALGYGIKEGVGTSLAALLLPVSLFAVIAYYRAGKLNIGYAFWIGFGLIFGAIAGARFALGLDSRVLNLLYGLFLLYMAWRFAEPRKWWAEYQGRALPPRTAEALAHARWYWLLILGVGAGILSGMFGIGGGIIIVAALVEFLHFDQKQAVGTSLAALLPPVSFGAVLEYYNEGLLNLAVAACIAAGLVIGSTLGARIALGLSSVTVKRLYGIFLVFAGLRFILTSLTAA